MKLKDYLDENGIARHRFAAILGVHTDAIFRWQRGAVPRKAVMARIVEATGGQVQPSDFYQEDAA